jgi:hypothetical protein
LKYRMSARLRQGVIHVWCQCDIICGWNLKIIGNIASIGWIADNFSYSCKDPPKTKLNFCWAWKGKAQATGECCDWSLYPEQPHENHEACELTHMCQIYSRVRRRTLGDFELRSEELISADLKSVLSFIKATRKFKYSTVKG